MFLQLIREARQGTLVSQAEESDEGIDASSEEEEVAQAQTEEDDKK
jgi:hypothetical protein